MTKKLSNDEFLERFNKTETSKYFDIIGEYITGRLPIKVKCKTCGKEYLYSQASQLLAYTRKGCPDCFKGNKNINKLNLKTVNESIENRGFVCVEFTDSHTHATCICLSCGRKYKKLIHNLKHFRKGNNKSYKYCLLCNDKTSVGEKIMAIILDKLGIEYFHDATLLSNKRYRYDFVLYNEKIIIEIDGSTHRDRRNLYGDNKYSENDRKIMDEEKDTLAKNEGYTMIRIKYNNNKLGKFFIDIANSLNNYININDINLSLVDLFCLHK